MIEYDQESPENELTDHHISPDVGFEAIATGRPSIYCQQRAIDLYDYYNTPLIIKKKIKKQVYSQTVNKDIEVDNRLPSVAGFCRMQGISRTTFYRWCKDHKEFSNIALWGKVILEEMLVQKLYRGEVDSGSVVALNQLMHKYDSDLMELPKVALDEGAGVEETPMRQKGYDLAKIDDYCGDEIIETIAVKKED